MRKIAVSGSKVLVYILGPNEKPLPREICFTEEEYQWSERLANAMPMPEEKQSFWNGVIEGKRKSSSFSVLKAFPKENLMASPPPRKEHGPGAPKEVAIEYCERIKAQLMGSRAS